MTSSILRRLAKNITGMLVGDLPNDAFGSHHYIEYSEEDRLDVEPRIQLGLGHPAFGGLHEENWTVSEELEEVGADTKKLNSIWDKYLGDLGILGFLDEKGTLADGTNYEITSHFDMSDFDYAAGDNGGGYWSVFITISFDDKANVEDSDITKIIKSLGHFENNLFAGMQSLASELNDEFDNLNIPSEFTPNFTVMNYRIQIEGICKECSAIQN